MADPDAVARALARLAADSRPEDSDDRAPDRTVAAAETAMTSLDSAAAFVDRGGEAELRRAVEAAEDEGERAVAARGRTVLSTLAAFRDAAGRSERRADAGETTSTPLAQRSSREGA